MKMIILKSLLAHEGEWLSGEEISRISGVSRTAIWKHMKQLKAEGYDIESAPSKGYRLVGTPTGFTLEGLRLAFADVPEIKEIVYLKTVDSTNGYGRKMDTDGALVLSEEQTGGRGRLGRAWLSPAGEGLWFTLVLRPEMEPAKAALITQIAAVAVWEGIKSATGIVAEIKWPNDILISEKKVTGILTEMTAELGHMDRLLVGIGINVNTEKFSDELEGQATSLKIVQGASVDRKMLLKEVVRNFYRHYKVFLEEDQIEEVMQTCKTHSSILGKEVRILRGGRESFGVAEDLGDNGELLLRCDDGTLSPLISGEVSIRLKTRSNE